MTTKKTKDVAKLLEELLALRKRLDRPLDSVPPTVRASHEVAQREARDRFADTLAAYEAALVNKWAAIFVSGPPETIQTFSDISARIGPAVTVPADGLWRKLTEPVSLSMRKDRAIEPSQFSHLLRALATTAQSLKLKSSPRPVYRDGTIAKTEDDIARYIRSAVLASDGGDELFAANFQSDAVKTAMDQQHAQNILPIVIPNATQDEQRVLSRLFKNRSVTISLDAATNEEQVVETFKELKAKFKR